MNSKCFSIITNNTNTEWLTGKFGKYLTDKNVIPYAFIRFRTFHYVEPENEHRIS